MYPTHAIGHFYGGNRMSLESQAIADIAAGLEDLGKAVRLLVAELVKERQERLRLEKIIQDIDNRGR